MSNPANDTTATTIRTYASKQNAKRAMERTMLPLLPDDMKVDTEFMVVKDDAGNDVWGVRLTCAAADALQYPDVIKELGDKWGVDNVVITEEVGAPVVGNPITDSIPQGATVLDGEVVAPKVPEDSSWNVLEPVTDNTRTPVSEPSNVVQMSTKAERKAAKKAAVKAAVKPAIDSTLHPAPATAAPTQVAVAPLSKGPKTTFKVREGTKRADFYYALTSDAGLTLEEGYELSNWPKGAVLSEISILGGLVGVKVTHEIVDGVKTFFIKLPK